MAIRTVQYTVSAGGISPTSIQSGGIQGEHNATELEFTLEPSLLLKIQHQAGDNTPLYRFDAYSATGEKISTEPKELDLDVVVFPLSNQITNSAADVRVYLIISVLENDKTLMDLYSFPAVLSIYPLPDGEQIEIKEYSSITALYSGAKAAADSAKESADAAALSAERTENAKLVLEDGTEIIFLGGDAESALDIELVVDNTVTQSSPNPVQSSAIYAYIEKALNKAKLDAHPVGSYYWSTVDTDPAELFGGTWEQVTDKFILAAGEEYTAGDTGGAAVHAHTLGKGYALIGQGMGNTTCLTWQKSWVDGSYNKYSATYRTGELGVYAKSEETAENIGEATALAGSTDNGNTMPPYEVAYCFKRTA